MKHRTRYCCYAFGFCAFWNVVGFLTVMYLPCLPPDYTFPDYEGTPPRPLDKVPRSQALFNNAEHIYEGVLKGPESIAVKDGALYTGVFGGRIVRIKDGGISTVTQIGDVCSHLSEGSKCGRPMGMRFHSDGYLYVTDAYFGLLRIDVATGENKTLFGSSEVVDGRRSLFPNDLDISTDGTIYWSDCSTNVPLEEVTMEMLAEPSGRVLSYNIPKRRSRELVKNVHCASGVQLSTDEDYLLIAEGGRDRIIRYYLEGPKKNTKDVFIDGLPGVPDKIRSDGKGGYLVTLIIQHPSMLSRLRNWPLLRRLLARLLYYTELPFRILDEWSPNGFSKRVVYSLGNMDYLTPFFKTKAIVLALDSRGNITGSYSSSDGSASLVSEVVVLNNYTYMASPYNPYLIRMKATPEIKNLIKPTKMKKVDSEKDKSGDKKEISPLKERQNLKLGSTEVKIESKEVLNNSNISPDRMAELEAEIDAALKEDALNVSPIPENRTDNLMSLNDDSALPDDLFGEFDRSGRTFDNANTSMLSATTEKEATFLSKLITSAESTVTETMTTIDGSTVASNSAEISTPIFDKMADTALSKKMEVVTTTDDMFKTQTTDTTTEAT